VFNYLTLEDAGVIKVLADQNCSGIEEIADQYLLILHVFEILEHVFSIHFLVPEIGIYQSDLIEYCLSNIARSKNLCIKTTLSSSHSKGLYKPSKLRPPPSRSVFWLGNLF